MRLDRLQITRRLAVGGIAAAVLTMAVPTQVSAASSAAEIEAKSRAALNQLLASNPKAAAVGKKAKGVMVFPKIIKGGFVIAGSSGDGTLFVNGKATRFFNMSSASVGLQAGAQGYGYALFFMNEQKMAETINGASWDAGSDASIAFIDKGAEASLDTANLNKAIYAFAFSQKGLMGGVSLKGSRIKEIHPK
ncbi:lipid-binding SYLF domain-containing protein [Novosphingobium sp. PhB165]|uniref:lipid-binding SYLF domain-containing protein n=1 Tax=Novosphingobium sp. PhB165 TaxID=2485105 RepID=UPI001042E315|nr:lipid-binding SYLF domain-containing protein [Novosphingobium sp. PhB165]TCM20426.1 lipid-binding SYLF domain-containing protein [Novosphingobium sp. PhB165]